MVRRSTSSVHFQSSPTARLGLGEDRGIIAGIAGMRLRRGLVAAHHQTLAAAPEQRRRLTKMRSVKIADSRSMNSGLTLPCCELMN
jgi:hypothetical protein